MLLCSSRRTFFRPCATSSPLVPASNVSFKLPLHTILNTLMQFHSPAPTISTCRFFLAESVILASQMM